MLIFKKSLEHYNTDIFAKTLKSEIENLPTGSLPLHKGTTQGGMVDDSDISATIIKFSANETAVQAKVGVFFNEVIGGCSCGDDPLSENAYCEILLLIDQETGEVSFAIIKE